jgi:hypothetical protein
LSTRSNFFYVIRLFKALCGAARYEAPGSLRLERNTLHILAYILAPRDRGDEIKAIGEGDEESAVCALLPSYSLAKSHAQASSTALFWNSRGMLLPYYKSDCPHMDVSGCWLEMLFFYVFLRVSLPRAVNFFPIAFFSSPLRFYAICKTPSNDVTLRSQIERNALVGDLTISNQASLAVSISLLVGIDESEREAGSENFRAKKKETPAQQTEQLHAVTSRVMARQTEQLLSEACFERLKAYDRGEN